MSVKLNDFQPLNKWIEDTEGEKFESCSGEEIPKYIIDQTTNRKYLNESRFCVGNKCLLLTIGTPFVHAIAGIIAVAFRTLKVISFYHFWRVKTSEDHYDGKERLKDLGKCLLRIVLEPIAILGLELSALYGVLNPYDGRKLYASIERAQYGHFILAPCFQPDPTQHLLGSDVNHRNVW